MRSAIFALLFGVIQMVNAQEPSTPAEKVITYDDDKATLTLTYSSELGGDAPY